MTYKNQRKPWVPERAPVSPERLAMLRAHMGPEVWDILEPFMPETLIQAYDTVCEVLYGGDVTGAEEVQVSGGKKGSRWPFKDARALPIKAGMDYYLTRCARAILKG